MNKGAEAEADLSQIHNLIDVSFDTDTNYSALVDQVLLEPCINDIMSSAKAHMDTSLPELIRELGYSFTSNVETCKAQLRQLGTGPDIHAATVARIIGVMVRTHTGLDDPATLQNMNATGTSIWDKDKSAELGKTWDVAVFIKAVQELQPTLHWKEIIYELDHPGFLIKDRQGLTLLLEALKMGFKVQGFNSPFPVDMFYRPWKNTEGQVSLFQHCLRNPDVFNFGEQTHHPVILDGLKVMPDLENKDIAPWKSIDLISTLLDLAEAGHIHSVKEMFAVPQKNCPDLLTLGLIQNPQQVTTNLRTELLVNTIQTILASHPNSTVVLTRVWTTTTMNCQMIVMHSMGEWYSKAANEMDSEHNRLSRILDLAQDLKALSYLLQAKPVPFVIDLAVMAARREYLNLDKWLGDQMKEHGESFVKAVVQYLQRKIPTILSTPLKEDHLTAANLQKESLALILVTLQQVSGAVGTDLREPISNMVQNCQPLLQQAAAAAAQNRGQAASSVRPPAAPSAAPGSGGGGGAPGSSGGPVRPTPRAATNAPGGGFPPGMQHDALLNNLASQIGERLNLGTGPIGSAASTGSGGNTSTSAFSNPSNLRGSTQPPPGSPSRMFGAPGAPVPPQNPADGGASPSIFAPNLGLSQQAGSQNAAVSNGGANNSNPTAGGGTMEQMKAGMTNLSSLFPDLQGPISREVEDEANSYFQRIYNHPPHPTLTIDEVLGLLKKFQESSQKRERDVFNCMIKNLFEEYKYFPQYPEKELHTTAQLFGGIIEHGLVTMIPLGLALRFVLDAVRKSPDSKMYFFGIAALDRFKSRLKDYPQYCQHVTCIGHFKSFPAHLIKWIEFGGQSQAPPDKPSGDVLPLHLQRIINGSSAPGNNKQQPPTDPAPGGGPPGAPGDASVIPNLGGVSVASTDSVNKVVAPGASSTAATAATSSSSATSSTIARPTAANRPSIANTTNIDTLLKAGQKKPEVKVPEEKLQERVAFIFNNLSVMNMGQKKEDLLKVLKSEDEDYTGWLAQYLVMKRASIEPNFHSLYANFLDCLCNEPLHKEVLTETYSNIKILLGSDKSTANFSDRSLLKNLGHWLGFMTLAKDQPILLVDLDLKPLVIEAYHNGQQELLYVVPFVAKVLESASKSKVFKPPCPWTMGLMNLLAELHQEHDLKLNLKFEIEVLCKSLNIELNTLHPGNLLKDYDKLNQMLNVRSFGITTTTKQQSSMLENPPLTRMMPPGGSMSNAGRSSMGSMGGVPPMGGGLGDPMGVSMNSGSMQLGGMQHGMVGPAGSNAPGSAGASLGAILMATPQQQQQLPSNAMMPGGQASFLPPNSGPLPLGGSLAGGSGVQPATSMASGSDNASALAKAQAQASLMRPVEPKFNYTDISTSNLNAIVPHISVDSRLNLFKDLPDLNQLIKIAIEKSIQEWAAPVIDRAIRIALTTCEHIVKKDFSLDHDENRMRQGAHNMVRTLTSGMAMITCRDHLLLSIKSHLKNFMLTLGRNFTPEQSESIEMNVAVVANDNVELACAFIQKKAIEKATAEIDKRLSGEYNARILARKEGRAYCDPVALNYQVERMPEAIRLKHGGVTAKQSAVYEEFARNVPGFKPLTDGECASIAPKALVSPDAADASSSSAAGSVSGAGSQHGRQGAAGTAVAVQPTTSEECVQILEEVLSKVEPFVSNCTSLPASPHMNYLHALVEGLSLARSTKDPSPVDLLIRKAVEALLEGLTSQMQQPVETESLARYRDANLLVLRALSDERAYGTNWVMGRVTTALIEAHDDIKHNPDAVDCLIRSGLVRLFEFDKHLASVISINDNPRATVFAMHLCRMYLIDDRSNAQIIESDLFGTIEALQKVAAQNQRPPDGLIHLMDMIKMSSERLEQNLARSGPTAQLHSGIAQAKEFEDPPGLLEKTEYLLREWVNAYHSREAGKDSRQAFVIFVQLMNQHGILKTDDLITRFFRMSTQMCVDLCYRALGEPNNSPTLVRAKCFHTLDAYVRLITLLVKHSGETQNTVTKVNLLNKVLGIVAGVLLIDHDVRTTNFQQVPYHRIFIMLFLELNSPDVILENINFQVLTAYCNMLHILRPSKAPGFAFAWLEIVSHRVFLGKILAQTQNQKGWPMYAQLLVDLFKFLSPFLRNAELAKPVHRLYRGTLRVLLVLLHDFPEFLCDYHYNFCDVIPPNCIQMRNLILSAFPRNMRLPDPFTPNLKVELLPEIAIAPRTVANYAAVLAPNFKKDLDSYLKNRSPVDFLSEVRSNLQVSTGDSPGNRYNIQLINALVMYVGTSAIQYIRTKGLQPNMSTIAHSSHMDIFQNLAVDMDTEGRYLFLNCIANQLRYPNSHTHYFSCTLLYLFAEANQESIQEQITRVLLERLIVNRPHPWGLLITFIELIKNPSYKFWSHEFVQCAPEIQKLFESVARSCMVQAQAGPRLEGPPAPAGVNDVGHPN